MPSLKQFFRRKKPVKTHKSRPDYQDPDIQPCLPLKRARALTSPLPALESIALPNTAKQWTSLQSNCPLLQLPLELRLHIYELVLGQRKIHVALDFGSLKFGHVKKGGKVLEEWRWWHSICIWDQAEDSEWLYDNCCDAQYMSRKSPPYDKMGKLKVDFDLLLTCRTIYSEAIDVLYSTNTFQFRTQLVNPRAPAPALWPYATRELLHDFSRHILPQRFAAITSVEEFFQLFPGICPHESADGSAESNATWNSMWAVLASMPHLKHLRFCVLGYECVVAASPQLQEAWLGPLEQLRAKNLETFDFVIPRSYVARFTVADDAPFNLGISNDINRTCH